MSTMEILAEPRFFLCRPQRGSVPCSLLACCGWLALVGIPRLVEASPDLCSLVHVVSFPCMEVSLSRFPFYTATSHIGQGPTLMTSFYFHFSEKALHLQTSPRSKVLGVRTLTNLSGRHIQSITVINGSTYE